MLDEEERNSKKGRKLLDDGIELLKIATIKYSKYQTRYMLNKFIKVPDTKKVIFIDIIFFCSEVMLKRKLRNCLF